MAGDRSDFDESEPEVLPLIDCKAIFIEAGGESYAVGEFDSEVLDRVLDCLDSRVDPSTCDGFEGPMVNDFGINAEDE
jgi:hypothetical protein